MTSPAEVDHRGNAALRGRPMLRLDGFLAPTEAGDHRRHDRASGRGGGPDRPPDQRAAQEKAGWFGKTFKSAGDVRPLVCLDARREQFSDKAMGKVKASSGWKDFRAKSPPPSRLANPVHDHFEKMTNNDAVIGIMNDKGVLELGSGALLLYLDGVATHLARA